VIMQITDEPERSGQVLLDLKKKKT
jgi:hypothetical protein